LALSVAAAASCAPKPHFGILPSEQIRCVPDADAPSVSADFRMTVSASSSGSARMCVAAADWNGIPATAFGYRPVDVVFLLDATGSMGAAIAKVKDNLNAVATALRGLGPNMDVRFGVASFRDYPELSHTTSGADYVFKLHRALTPDVDAVRSTINSITAAAGASLPESGLEALFQVATGAGYDYTRAGGTFQTSDPYNASITRSDTSSPKNYCVDPAAINACADVAPSNAGWDSNRQAVVVLVTDASFTEFPGDSRALSRQALANVLNAKGIKVLPLVVKSGFDVKDSHVATGQWESCRLVRTDSGGVGHHECFEKAALADTRWIASATGMVTPVARDYNGNGTIENGRNGTPDYGEFAAGEEYVFRFEHDGGPLIGGPSSRDVAAAIVEGITTALQFQVALRPGGDLESLALVLPPAVTGAVSGDTPCFDVTVNRDPLGSAVGRVCASHYRYVTFSAQANAYSLRQWSALVKVE
jgi:hypothetical protein